MELGDISPGDFKEFCRVIARAYSLSIRSGSKLSHEKPWLWKCTGKKTSDDIFCGEIITSLSSGDFIGFNNMGDFGISRKGEDLRRYVGANWQSSVFFLKKPNSYTIQALALIIANAFNLRIKKFVTGITGGEIVGALLE